MDTGRVLRPLRNFFANEICIAQSLVVDPHAEEFVEVKVVLHEKANVATLELTSLIAKDVRLWPHVSIKGPRGVGGAPGVPFEAANTDLESVHAHAVVLQLLVTILRLVESVLWSS